MGEAKRLGYEVEPVYIRLASPALALERVAARMGRGGHGVPSQDVVRRFSRSLENLSKAVRLADKVTILDNSSGNYIKFA